MFCSSNCQSNFQKAQTKKYSVPYRVAENAKSSLENFYTSLSDKEDFCINCGKSTIKPEIEQKFNIVSSFFCFITLLPVQITKIALKLNRPVIKIVKKVKD